MKTFARVISVLMMVAILASLLAACGEKGYKDENVLGTWTQTDEDYGNWTWTFNEDGTCHLYSETDNFDSDGTYWIESENSGRIYITLDTWGEEKLCTYAVTPKVMVLEHMDFSFRCYKQ